MVGSLPQSGMGPLPWLVELTASWGDRYVNTRGPLCEERGAQTVLGRQARPPGGMERHPPQEVTSKVLGTAKGGSSGHVERAALVTAQKYEHMHSSGKSQWI